MPEGRGIFPNLSVRENLLLGAYARGRAERPRSLALARELCTRFKEATTSALACDILDRAMAAAEADQCYAALKLARRIIRHEDSVLGRDAGERSQPELEDACLP